MAKIRLKHLQTAHGMVGFVLVMPILLLLILVIIAFGHLFFVSSSLVSASHEAAHWGAAVGEVSSTSQRCQDCDVIHARAGDLDTFTGVSAKDLDHNNLNRTFEAVAHVQTASGLFSGDALHVLARNECNALRFSGSSEILLIGGNAFSDSRANGNGSCPDLPDNGGESCTSGIQDGSGMIWIADGTLYLSGGWRKAGGSGDVITNGEINECQSAQDTLYIPLPDCTDLQTQSYSAGQETINEGVYPDGIQVNGGKTNLKLMPGIYCLDNSFIVNEGTITGENVLIYMRGGNFSLGGNAIVNLKAAAVEDSHYVEDASGQNWSGMLVYMPHNNHGEVHVGGGLGSRYTGTIYAPGPRDPSSKEKCILEGSGTNIGLASNIICYSIKIGGNAAITIDYQKDATFHTPLITDLAQ